LADDAIGQLASRIQYTLVATGVTRSQVEEVCAACLEHSFHAAMLPGCWVATARELLGDGPVKLASTVDFPLGIASTRGKVAEAVALVEAGADELDVAVNLGYLKSGMDEAFEADIAEVVRAVSPRPIKVMLELPLLDSDECERAVKLAMRAGAQYLKNASSGAVGVATTEEMRWLRSHAGTGIGVKASGGIRTREHALQLIEAGADLLGTSAAVDIVTGRESETLPDY
jgi:deoxyribose-phosphate aldolase